MSIRESMSEAMALAREGNYGRICERVSSRFYERWLAYGLRRDLKAEIAAPKARIPISVRELTFSDVPILFPRDEISLPRNEQKELDVRRAHLNAGIPTCYVAVDQQSGRACYFQWLMTDRDNEAIQRHFEGRFPLIARDEALLENAYTPVEYRGKGIMPAAMSMIAEKAIPLGKRYAITFVEHDNVPSLKGCRRAGFEPYLARHDSRFAGGLVRRRHFEKLPDGFRFSYELEKNGKITQSSSAAVVTR